MAKGSRVRDWSAMVEPDEPPSTEIAAQASGPTRDPKPTTRTTAPLDGPPPTVVGITLFVTEEDRTKLKLLAIQRKTSVQQLGLAAWNLLLAQGGLPPLTPTTVSMPSYRNRKK